MSIIYDALQKTQRNRESKREMNEKQKTWRFSISIDIALLVILAVLVVMVIVAYYPRVKTYLAAKSVIHKAAPVAVVAKQPEPATLKAGLTLNGVFLSDSEKLAMINNQTFHQGDMVEGMKIIAIDLNKVKLQKDDQVFDLEVVG